MISPTKHWKKNFAFIFFPLFSTGCCWANTMEFILMILIHFIATVIIFAYFLRPKKTMLSTVFTVSAQNVVYTWHDTKQLSVYKTIWIFFHVVWNASRALLHSFCLFATFFLPEKLIDPIANMRNFYVSCISFEWIQDDSMLKLKCNKVARIPVILVI